MTPRARIRKLTTGLAIASAIAVTSPAAALKLGSLAPPDSGGCGNCFLAQRKTGTGEPSYVVPDGKWTITFWSTQGGGTAAGKAQLMVLRPTGVERQLKLVKQSKFETVPADGHPLFPTNLTVRGGDLIGIYTQDNLAAGFGSPVKKSSAWLFNCSLSVGDLIGTGTTCDLNVLKSELTNVEVTLSKR